MDFFCHAAKLVIEVDGSVHEKKEQREIDEHRRNVFKLRGLEELRFSNKEVLNSLNEVLEKISEIVKMRM